MLENKKHFWGGVLTFTKKISHKIFQSLGGGQMSNSGIFGELESYVNGFFSSHYVTLYI